MSALGEAAKRYAELGFAVFPLKAGGKTPATAHGVKDATTDLEQIDAWWTASPHANVGIACGEKSGGLFVIDVDVDESAQPPKDGSKTMKAWEVQHGAFTDTAISRTGRGGIHMFYKTNEAPQNQANYGKCNVDIRADGGYVVAPPSVHENGSEYKWISSPLERPVAYADCNVLAFVKSIGGFGKEAAKDAARFELPERIESGHRNWTMYLYACSLRSLGGERDDMLEKLMRANEERCVPKLPEAEVRQVCASACTHPKGHAGGKRRGRPARCGFDHEEVGKSLIEKQGFCFIDGAPAVRVDGGAYVVGWREVNHAIIQMIPGTTEANRREVARFLECEAPYREQNYTDCVAFRNGLVNIRTLEMVDWPDDAVIANVIPHDWNPGARCALVDSTLRDIANGDMGLELNLAEIIGLCMYRDSGKYATTPVLIDPRGGCGKSTFLRLVRNTIGNGNCSALTPQDCGNNFYVSALAGKLANIADDIPNEFLNGAALAVVKKIATSDVIHADIKYGTPFDFKPYCTMVISCNEFPALADTSGGTERRWLPCRLTRRFVDTDSDDIDLSSKLKEEKALERACVLGVTGMQRVMANGGFTRNKQTEELRRELRADSNNILAWIDDGGLDRGYFDGMALKAAHTAYSEWCAAAGYRFKSLRSFTACVRDEMALDVVAKRGAGGAVAKCFVAQ